MQKNENAKSLILPKKGSIRNVFFSGKGGVGKTTTTANLGTALSLENKKTVVVDADIGLRNLDVVMGL
ncbi:P-loop NTPase, partial [Casaltella massiliensis]|nr:P-loop NTPase [Casaltella massiliensis]